MIEKRIEEILDKIRPYLNNHGGDIDFINYNDGIVYVSLKGMCANCIHANKTITDMIQSSLMLEMPEIKKVVNVEREI